MDGSMIVCPQCRGDGYVSVRGFLLRGTETVTKPCPTCGTGGVVCAADTPDATEVKQ